MTHQLHIHTCKHAIIIQTTIQRGTRKHVSLGCLANHRILFRNVQLQILILHPVVLTETETHTVLFLQIIGPHRFCGHNIRCSATDRVSEGSQIRRLTWLVTRTQRKQIAILQILTTHLQIGCLDSFRCSDVQTLNPVQYIQHGHCRHLACHGFIVLVVSRNLTHILHDYPPLTSRWNHKWSLSIKQRPLLCRFTSTIAPPHLVNKVVL